MTTAERTLYRGGIVMTDESGSAGTAVLVKDVTVAWLGSDAEAGTLVDAEDARGVRVVELDGALVTPGFVDAHAHLSATGAGMRGVDLSDARSLNEALSRVEAATRRTGGRPLLVQNWDESTWPERRPFTATELDRATYGGVVYAPRVDGHSAVVSSALAAAARLRDLRGWQADGVVQTDAHHRAREAFASNVSRSQRQDDIRSALRSAAAAGIVAVHENAGPVVSSADDHADVRTVAGEPGMPEVVRYWAQLVATDDEAREVARTHDVTGLAGDLNVDGSIGSRTASLREDYTDRSGEHGNAYLCAAQVRDHLVACTRAGLQGGFHVIGDAGVDTVLAGLEDAAAMVGEPAVRAARHRLEHVEMVGPEGVAVLARLGVMASMQPAFDAAWGGAGGMYAERLGPGRVPGMNPFRSMVDAGVILAFGSDSPVTAFAPWEGVRAAVHHRDSAQRLTATEAFHAQTTGGYAAARLLAAGRGLLTVGAPATFAVWDGWQEWAGEDGQLVCPPAVGPVPVARLVVRAGQVIHPPTP